MPTTTKINRSEGDKGSLFSALRMARSSQVSFGCGVIPEQHADLMLLGQDLEVLGCIGAGEQRHPAQHSGEHQVGESEGHGGRSCCALPTAGARLVDGLRKRWPEAVARSRQHVHHRDVARNVLGGELESCGTDPMTGFHRDGCCNTDAEDAGVHTVCAVEFLRFSMEVGNDLVTPRPEFGSTPTAWSRADATARSSASGGCRSSSAPPATGTPPVSPPRSQLLPVDHQHGTSADDIAVVVVRHIKSDDQALPGPAS